MESARNAGLIIRPIISKARVRCDGRGHRNFGIARRGIRMSAVDHAVAIACAIFASYKVATAGTLHRKSRRVTSPARVGFQGATGSLTVIEASLECNTCVATS